MNGQPIKTIKITEEKTIPEKISKLCLYLLIFLLPLLFLPWTISPVIINKQVLTMALVFFSSTCYLISALEKKKLIYPRSLLGAAVLLLLTIFGIATLFSKSFNLSFFGSFVQSDSFLVFLTAGLIFYLASVLFNREDISKIGWIFLSGLILTAIMGFFGLLGLGKRVLPLNTIGGLADFGIFLAFGLIVILGAWNYLNKWQKFALGALGILILLELIAINNSLVWLISVLTLFLLAAYRFIKGARINSALVILAVFLFFVFFGSRLPAIINLPTEIRPSLSSTFLTAREGLTSVKQILFGSGPATFGYDWNLYRPTELNQTNFWQVRFNQGFNFFGTLIPTAGILGGLAFLFLIFGAVRQGLKNIGDEKIFAIFNSVMLLLLSFFLFPSFFVQTIFVFLGLGLLVADSKKEFSFDIVLYKYKSFISLIVLIALMAGGLGLVYFLGIKYAAAVYYGKGIRLLNENNINDATVKLERAAALNSDSDEYQRVLSQSLLLKTNELAQKISALPQNLSELQEFRSRFQDETVKAVGVARLAADGNPNDSLNWSNLASIYENVIPFVLGADTVALENYEKARGLDPKNPDLSFKIGALHYNKKEIDESQKALEETLELNPNYSNALYLLGTLYSQEGMKDKAIPLFERLTLLNPDNSAVRQVLDNLKK